jgi:hypothetical protein
VDIWELLVYWWELSDLWGHCPDGKTVQWRSSLDGKLGEEVF